MKTTSTSRPISSNPFICCSTNTPLAGAAGDGYMFVTARMRIHQEGIASAKDPAVVWPGDAKLRPSGSPRTPGCAVRHASHQSGLRAAESHTSEREHECRHHQTHCANQHKH